MVTRSTLTKPRATDCQRLEPIPDPPREPDMRQPEAIHHAYEALRPHFPEDTLVSGGGYLLLKAGDLSEFYPDILIAMGVRDPKAVMWAQRVCDKRGGQAAGLRDGGGFPQHGKTRLHGEAGWLRALWSGRVLAIRSVGGTVARRAAGRGHAG